MDQNSDNNNQGKGMAKKWIFLIAAVILFGAYYMFGSMGSGSSENPYAGKFGVKGKGADAYKVHCVACHKEKGRGFVGPSLADKVFLYNDADVADSVYFQVIAKGTSKGEEIAGRKAKGRMPGFENRLNEEEIWSIVAYIRSLQ